MKPRIGAVLVVWLAGIPLSAQAQDANPARSDVYAIYSLMMSNPPTSFAGNELYAIAGITRLAMGDVISQMLNVPYPCIVPPPEYANRWAQVVEDFNARRDKPATLERFLTISKPYTFMTPDDISAFQSARGSLPIILPGTPPVTLADLQTGDPKFRGVRDMYFLSDVYFDKDRTLALTGLATWCGPLCGGGRWKIYEKLADGKWVNVRPARDCSVDA